MSSTQRHMIVATAGHIDHGKTALVRALTGMETDRLVEEKRRGITIELGFAFLGDHITLVDVPGHERFIKTMTAGISTVDLALLVVAADDGVMPQTREHLDILHLLGVPRLFVVFTKVAGQSPEWVDLLEAELVELIPEKYHPTLRIFRCDSLSGQGIVELKGALLEMPNQLYLREDSGVFRLAVDRAFSMKGFGRIVTGTILSGSVRVGERLWILPDKQEVRVRGLQLHGQDRSELRIGERAAVNLIGANVDRLQRGDWLVQPEAFLTTEILDVSLSMVSAAPVVKSRDRVRLHLGTRETLGRLMLISQDLIRGGEKAYAQIILESPVVATRGDRFIIRRYSPMQTLGGGVVLDPHPPKRRRGDEKALQELTVLGEASGAESLTAKVKFSGRSGVAMPVIRSFINLSGDRLAAPIQDQITLGNLILLGSVETGLLVASSVIEEAKSQLLNRMQLFHQQNSDLPGMSPAQLQSELSAVFPLSVIEYALGELLKAELTLEKGLLRKRQHQAVLNPALEALTQRLFGILEAAYLSPPSPRDIQRELALDEAEFYHLLNLLILQGRVVKTGEGLYWTSAQIHRAWAIIKKALEPGTGKTTAQLRDALGSPRRVAVSLLEYLDTKGFTLRLEETRTLGPKSEEAL